MKPNSMTPTLRITKAEQWEDDLWAAVENAISAGIHPRKFKSEASIAWQYALKQQAEYVGTVFKEQP